MRRTLRRGILLAVALAGLTACPDFKRWAYEGGDRDRWQQPERVVQSLAIEPGALVADLGSGSGYFTGRLADAAGPAGRVYAVDVDEAMNEALVARMREEGHPNVVAILAAPDDPRLPEPVDLVFTSNTYHHLGTRPIYFAKLRRSLRPGGRVAIVEYRGQGLFVRLFGHYTPAEEIRREMEQAGYMRVADFDFLERQSFQVFAPAGPAALAPLPPRG
jgi:arsenite methyltransferase